MINLTVNGQQQSIDVDETTPLLWVIRENLNLTGTKFGCGMAQCGACTVHVNGNPIRSCVTPVGSVSGLEITTIEGPSGSRWSTSGAAGLDQSSSAPVRLLPVGADHVCGCTAEQFTRSI